MTGLLGVGIALTVGPPVSANDDPAPRWRAIFRDGTHLDGENLHGFDHPQGDWNLAGQAVHDRGGGLRHLARLNAPLASTRSFVELRGGDRLAGRLAGVTRSPSGQMLAVVLRPAETVADAEAAKRDSLFGEPSFHVRAEMIVAWSNGQVLGPGGGFGPLDGVFEPTEETSFAAGCLYRLRDGGIESARSGRLTPEGLRLLTGDGVRLIPYERLLGCRFAESTLSSPLPGLGTAFVTSEGVPSTEASADSSIGSGDPNDATPPSTQERLLASVRTGRIPLDQIWPVESRVGPVITAHLDDGSRVSFSLALCRTAKRKSDDPHTGWAVLPAWSGRTIWLNRVGVTALTFRRRDEVPLEALPMRPITTAQGLAPAVARRSVGPRGQPLATASDPRATGLSMHAPLAVRIELPSGAKRLSGRVALAATVGRGGYAVGRIGVIAASRTDDDARETARTWTTSSDGTVFDSGPLTGSDDAKTFEVTLASDDRAVVLAADMHHQDVPPGEDVLDIRDDLAWIGGVVTLEAVPEVGSLATTPFWVPQLVGWTVVETRDANVTLEPVWLDKGRYQADPKWAFALTTDGRTSPLPPDLANTSPEANADPPPADEASSPRPTRRRRPRQSGNMTELLALERSMSVSLADGILGIEALSGPARGKKSRLGISLDGEPLGPVVHDDLPLDKDDQTQTRLWGLGGAIGRTATVRLSLMQEGDKDHSPASVVIEQIDRRPITEVPLPGGRWTQPTTALATLTPTATTGKIKPEEITRDPADSKLTVHGVPLSSILILPSDSSVTYEIPPGSRRFVAVVTAIDGWQGAGPYRIQVDDREIAQTTARLKREEPAWIVDVPLPPGADTLSFLIDGKDARTLLGDAGFVAR